MSREAVIYESSRSLGWIIDGFRSQTKSKTFLIRKSQFKGFRNSYSFHRTCFLRLLNSISPFKSVYSSIGTRFLPAFAIILLAGLPKKINITKNFEREILENWMKWNVYWLRKTFQDYTATVSDFSRVSLTLQELVDLTEEKPEKQSFMSERLMSENLAQSATTNESAILEIGFLRTKM